MTDTDTDVAPLTTFQLAARSTQLGRVITIFTIVIHTGIINVDVSCHNLYTHIKNGR